MKKKLMIALTLAAGVAVGVFIAKKAMEQPDRVYPWPDNEPGVEVPTEKAAEPTEPASNSVPEVPADPC